MDTFLRTAVMGRPLADSRDQRPGRLFTKDRSHSARRSALPAWLHTYNYHRQHSAIGKAAPITRLTNFPGQYS